MLADPVLKEPNRRAVAQCGVAATPVVEHLDVLEQVTKTKVEAWRKSLAKTPVVINLDNRVEPVTRPRAASSVNRDISALRAALNYAHDAGQVTTDLAWRVALRPTKNADGRRDAYLDLAERKALASKAAPIWRCCCAACRSCHCGPVPSPH